MITAANKSPKEKGAMQTMYFNPDQTRELLNLGDVCLPLMQYYVAIAHQTNPNMEDAHMATMLDKSAKTVEKARLTLTKAGWFKRIKTVIKGDVHIIYLVGKQAVQQHDNKPFKISVLDTGTQP